MRLVSVLSCVALLVASCGCKAQEPMAAEPTVSETPVEPEPIEVLGPAGAGSVPLPTVESETLPPAAPRTTYTVKRGDTLWSIAQRLYGDGHLWKAIYEANRDRVASPSAMKVGTELRIPPRP